MELVPKEKGGNKVAHLLKVTLGAVSKDQVEISSGLADGDEVISKGQAYLREGDYVYPTKWTNAGPTSFPSGSGKMESMPGMGGSSNNMKNMPGMGH